MTTQEVINRFSVLIDTYGSPNFSDTEALYFLNMAQNEFLARMIPDSLGQGVVNYELDQNTAENVSNLMIFVGSTVNANSEIPYSTINTLIRNTSGDSTCEVFRIIAVAARVSATETSKIKYTPWNNYYSNDENYFKQPSIKNRRWSIINQSNAVGKAVQIRPTPTDTIFLTVMKTPKVMAIGNTPDFNDYCLNQIITLALEYAQISTRDSEMLASIRNANISQ